MAQNPFRRIPKNSILKRSLGPAVICFFLGVFAIAQVSGASTLRVNPYLLSADDPPVRLFEGPFYYRVNQHYFYFFGDLFSPPSGCGWVEAESDFRRAQCQEFWLQMGIRGVVAALPFLFAWAWVQFALLFTRLIYRQAGRKVSDSRVQEIGVVTQPPRARASFGAWFFGLKAISVQMPNKKQMVVYLPEEAADPLPAEKLAVFQFEFGLLGIPRVGLLYAPHMAVVSGS